MNDQKKFDRVRRQRVPEQRLATTHLQARFEQLASYLGVSSGSASKDEDQEMDTHFHQMKQIGIEIKTAYDDLLNMNAQ
ncbi:MAG: hypothetical protein H7A37_03930 [Chlamydiales bacterium]|nr:hypothetical protein [Chlamydiia bacterium]MCP5507436.1 hypothetical protein [Chlamydiales bacterium]